MGQNYRLIFRRQIQWTEKRVPAGEPEPRGVEARGSARGARRRAAGARAEPAAREGALEGVQI